MNVVVRHRIMSIEDFLAWEARQEIKYEFDGFEPVAMAGGTLNHAALQRNLAVSIGGRLRGTGCAFYGSDLKVVTASQSRYPDGQVICGAIPGSVTFTTSPTILFEVVSAGDRARDHEVKATEYRGIASVRRYVILEQDRVAATVWAWEGDVWAATGVGAGGGLVLPEVGIEVPLGELYEGVDLIG